jgi:hypothetical protein
MARAMPAAIRRRTLKGWGATRIAAQNDTVSTDPHGGARPAGAPATFDRHLYPSVRKSAYWDSEGMTLPVTVTTGYCSFPLYPYLDTGQVGGALEPPRRTRGTTHLVVSGTNGIAERKKKAG